MFKSLLTGLLIVLVTVAGCNKQGANNALVGLPDVSDFTITGASAFTAGNPSVVNVYSTSIGSGTYKVYFDLGGSNYATSQSATLIMNNSYGSFTTPNLANAGETFISLNSITNINGGGTAFTQNNKYTLSDSTGIMTGTIGGSIMFSATDVLATINGTKLIIRGVESEPLMSSMTLNVDNYNHSNGLITFSNYDVPEVASIQYQMPGGGTVSANGTINIQSVNPTLSGTYSFKGMDSTVVTSGTFNVAPPIY